MIRSIAILVAFAGFAFADDKPTDTPKPLPAQAKLVSAAKAETPGRWIVIGPGMKIMDQGVYLFIFAPYDAARQAIVTTFDTTGISPAPTPVPTDLRGQIATAITKVTDPKKIETAATLAKALSATIVTAKAGQITQDQLVMALGLIGPTMTGWTDFFAVLNGAIKTSASVQTSADILQIAVDELGKVK